MSPDRRTGQQPDLPAIRKLIKEIGGNRPPTPEQIMLQRISERVTGGQDAVTTMRVELYLMDVIVTVQTAQDMFFERTPQVDELLLDGVKRGSGFRNLDTVMEIPDDTTTSFIGEVWDGLKELKNQKPQ